MQPAYLAFSTVTIRAESICAYCNELVTNGGNGVGIRMVSFAPTAGPAAQQFPSWPALTSMRPGHGPFRVPLSDCR